jgi:large subunit ribosomal protein L30
MASKLKIRQVKSAINRSGMQKKTIRALGIRRLNQTVVHDDNPCIRGMVKKVEHLVHVEEIDE